MTTGPTLGADLRACRLVHRRDRLRRAIAALEVRVRRDGDARQATSATLLAAIAGFEHELAEATAELQTLRRQELLDRPGGPLAA